MLRNMVDTYKFAVWYDTYKFAVWLTGGGGGLTDVQALPMEILPDEPRTYKFAVLSNGESIFDFQNQTANL